MRPSQKNRSGRNKNGRKPLGNVVNRVFESAGPEGKVRGTPQQIIDKYLLLARDAQTSGDRVTAENFLQHAEHYIRLLNVAQEQGEDRRLQFAGGPRMEQEDRDDDDDGDEIAENAPVGEGERAGAGGFERRREGEDVREPRADQPRADQPRADQPRADQPRADQPRADQPREPWRRPERDQNRDQNRERPRDFPRDRREDRRDERREERPQPALAASAGGLETIDPREDEQPTLVATPEDQGAHLRAHSGAHDAPPAPPVVPTDMAEPPAPRREGEPRRRTRRSAAQRAAEGEGAPAQETATEPDAAPAVDAQAPIV